MITRTHTHNSTTKLILRVLADSGVPMNLVAISHAADVSLNTTRLAMHQLTRDHHVIRTMDEHTAFFRGLPRGVAMVRVETLIPGKVEHLVSYVPMVPGQVISA